MPRKTALMKSRKQTASEDRQKPSVMIGFLAKVGVSPIPTITRVFIEGLKDKYRFAPFFRNRRYGNTEAGSVTFWNVYYMMKHLTLWIAQLVRLGPDIAHYPLTGGWNLEKCLYFLRIARLFRAKTVAHLHGGAFDEFWEGLSPARKARANRLLRSLDAVVVLGDSWREWVSRNTDVSPSTISVVSNPIDLEFEREALQWSAGGSDRVFFVGSLGTRKGLFDIIEALVLLKARGQTPPVTMAGPEEQRGARAALEGLVAEHGLRHVTVLHPVLGTEKLALFKGNGIFLFPSHKENFPLVVIESAAAARAIITTPVGALPEFFQHERSLLYVQPGNSAEIAGAIESLVGDQEKRRKLGSAARDVFVTSLTRERICSSLDHVYRGVLASDA